MIATMVLPADDEARASPGARARRPTPEAKAEPRGQASEAAAHRAAARRAPPRRRRGAPRRLRARSTLADYRPDHLLRVLIGEPGRHDAARAARVLLRRRRVHRPRRDRAERRSCAPGRQLEREITLVYTLYEPGDRACCPKGGDTRVHFRWTGDALEPREAIPPDAERMPPAR